MTGLLKKPIDNLTRLQKLLDKNKEHERLMIAEISRELGQFEQSLAELDFSFSNIFANQSQYIRNLAKRNFPKVKTFPVKPRFVPYRFREACRSDPKRYIRHFFEEAEVKKLIKLSQDELVKVLLKKIDQANLESEIEYIRAIECENLDNQAD